MCTLVTLNVFFLKSFFSFDGLPTSVLTSRPDTSMFLGWEGPNNSVYYQLFVISTSILEWVRSGVVGRLSGCYKCNSLVVVGAFQI